TTWYCLLVTIFLTVRATTTLAAGPQFSMPGTGWRAAWQLLLAAVLLAGLLRPRIARTAVTLVAATYLLATISEALNPADLLGFIPVDMRDRIVHPALSAAGLACVAANTALARTRRIGFTSR
ncbi:DUF4383 domain-containing protein, partial [Streptomyces sp. NPDC101166]|uniref:DUF4383 domain-containing protein n=1 Tax=Streptomyces sp. NPDC101166 TaxID=3366120 RepID=UPI00382325CE